MEEGILSEANFIKSLSLLDFKRADDVVSLLGHTRSTEKPKLPDDLQAAVDAGSILSFVDGTTPQERDDVLYSVQLADRAASGKFDRFEETQSWYKMYLEVLRHIGWTVEQFAFTEYDQGQGEFRMDKAALEIIKSIASANQLLMLTSAIDALGSLAADKGAVKLFEFLASRQASGNFQVGAVQRSRNNALSMAMGAFYFNSGKVKRRFLFFSWGDEDVCFWSGAQKMTLNTTLYAQHRDVVRNKLGASAADFIEALEIA